jgi:hypothetical protein
MSNLPMHGYGNGPECLARFACLYEFMRTNLKGMCDGNDNIKSLEQIIEHQNLTTAEIISIALGVARGYIVAQNFVRDGQLKGAARNNPTFCAHPQFIDEQSAAEKVYNFVITNRH